MKKLKCPQCDIANLFVKNEKGDRLLIFVTEDLTIIPSLENESIEGFNLDEIFCLGCSWSGSIRRLKSR